MEQIEAVSKAVIKFLEQNRLIEKTVTLSSIVDYVVSANANTSVVDEYDFLDYSEVKALEDLMNLKAFNQFPALQQQ